MTNINNSQKYDESNIDVLEGLEAVRKRPGMYIGSTSERGLHHLVWEIVDNSIDEALAGHASEIIIEINEDNSITVIDDGRGIPIGIMEKTGRPAVETIMTVLHAGGKFGGGGYKVSGGLHGVGASVVNALSKKLTIEVSRDGGIYFQEYQKGLVQADLNKIGDTNKTGTKTTFWPDEQIFTETITYNYETIKSRAKELAFLNRDIKINLIDKRTGENDIFHYVGGISEFVKMVSENKSPITKEIIAFEKNKNDIIVDIAMQYNESYQTNIYSYVNNINTHEGGTHEDGFKTVLTRAINSYGKKNNLIKAESLTGEDTREGLVAIISIKHPHPQFEGQTKTKLGNSDAKIAVTEVMGEELEKYFLENPEVVKKIIEKGLTAQKARVAAKKARELTRKQSALESSTLPGKLADCSSKNPEISEIYVVEGDSAGGSAKQGRDRTFQAILPLRGKVINVEKANIRKVLENEEIRSLITAIGAGISDDFDLEKIRYHKIIIMTDADVDGAHIRTLLLTFFYRQMKPLIENGNIFIAQPPLYKISLGKKIEYAYSDNEKDLKIAEIFNNQKVNIQRYKGLGEMNPEQLWETTMDPEVRTLLKVEIEDALKADEIFETLMGDEVAPRKEFIVSNAKYVKNIDL